MSIYNFREMVRQFVEVCDRLDAESRDALLLVENLEMPMSFDVHALLYRHPLFLLRRLLVRHPLLNLDPGASAVIHIVHDICWTGGDLHHLANETHLGVW